MLTRLFTIVCDFRGGTYVSQVRAPDEQGAVKAWAELLRTERPIKRYSTYLAKNIVNLEAGTEPIALEGFEGVWRIAAVCGDHLMMAEIVETVGSAKNC